MSDERIGESEEMDRDLKEYLACFKSNEGKQPKPKVILPVKEKVHKDYEKVVKDPSSKILNSSKKNSLSEDSSLFSASSPHKRFNLQDVSDLQTSHMISESDVTPPSAKQGDDNNSVSAIGKLVLSLKELGSTSEDTALNNNSDSNDPTSSFNINANVFTVEDLVAADNIESTASKSPADNDNKVTDNIFKSTGREAKSYLDDFEEEDGEDTLVEESFVSESIKENVSSSNTTEIRPSKSDGSVELTSTAVSSSPDVDEDSSINTNQTEKTQTFHHSSTLQSTSASTESSPSKHEVCTVNINPYCGFALGSHPN